MAKKKVEIEEVEEVEVIKEEPSVLLLNMDGTPYEGCYSTTLSAGVDLITTHDVTVYPCKDPVMVASGVRIENKGIDNMFAMLTLRSSMRKKGLSVLGSGIIDLDYKGEIVTPLIYLGPKTGVKIMKGERVFQLVLIPFSRFDNINVKNVERGSGGYGSTGR